MRKISLSPNEFKVATTFYYLLHDLDLPPLAQGLLQLSEAEPEQFTELFHGVHNDMYVFARILSLLNNLRDYDEFPTTETYMVFVTRSPGFFPATQNQADLEILITQSMNALSNVFYILENYYLLNLYEMPAGKQLPQEHKVLLKKLSHEVSKVTEQILRTKEKASGHLYDSPDSYVEKGFGLIKPYLQTIYELIQEAGFPELHRKPEEHLRGSGFDK